LIARESAISYLGALAALALGFVVKALLARALSVEDLGVLLIGQSIIGLFLVLSQLGLPDAVVRFVGMFSGRDAAKAKGIFIAALTIGLAMSVLIAIGLAVSAKFIAHVLYDESALQHILIILAVGLPLSTAAEVIAAAFRGIGQLWVKAIAVDLVKLIWIILMLLALMSFQANSLTNIAAGYSLSVLLSLVLAFGVYKISSQWSLSAARMAGSDLVRYSLPLLAASLLAGPIVNAGIPMLLGSLATAQAVAFYILALSLQMLLYLPVAALEQGALPVWSRQIGEGSINDLRTSFASITRWGYLAASIVFGLIFFNARFVLSILFGPDFAIAAPAVQASLLVALFGAAVGPNDGMLRALALTKWILWARLMGSGASLIAAFLLIPQWGLMGGVIAFAISGVVINSLYAGYLWKRHGIHPFDQKYKRILIGSFISLGLTGLLKPYGALTPMDISIGSLLYPVILIILLTILKAYSMEDMRAMIKAYRSFRD